MIVVDTSALMAILLNEPAAPALTTILADADALAISAGTMAETLIVADRRGCGGEMRRLLDGLGFEVVSVTPATARLIADAYARWGKGIDPAGLNFGDCFAYALAAERDAALAYVGEEFARTDITAALGDRL